MNTGTKRGRPALPAHERMDARRVVRMRSEDALRLERLAIALSTTEAAVLRLALDALVRSQREASPC
jgi:hypothetical protein